MIDLHTHILPGVDDGADTVSGAVEMCRMAANDGCRALVATPHQWHPTWDNTDRRHLEEQLQAVRRELGEEPRLFLGGEIRVDSDLLDRATAGSDLRDLGVVPLADSRYLLLELDRSGPTLDPSTVVHEFLVAGWEPILAHPELIPWLAEDLPLLSELVAHGASLQITAMSLQGSFGTRAKMAADALLEAGLVHFVASDCHGTATRRPGLRRAYDIVEGRFGRSLAEELMVENPGAVIENRPLAVRV